MAQTSERTSAAGTIRDAGAAWEPVRKSFRWTGTETAATLWSPAGSARIIITDVLVSITTASKLTVFEESNTLAKLCFEIDATDKGGASMPHLRTPIKTSGGATVKVTTNGGAGVVTVYGYEEPDL